MTDCRQVLTAMEELAPPVMAEEWDNVGLLVENPGPVTGILTALDITPQVVREAEDLGCNLVVSHHPVIFQPLKSLKWDNPACMLLARGMSGICMHTNLDAAQEGVNFQLAKLLGIQDPQAFIPCGRIGNLETTPAALAEKCRRTLGAAVKMVEGSRPIHKVAVISGAGGSMLEDALAAGADALVTGEAAHHIALAAQAAGITLVVAGHFATERPVVEVVAGYLAARFPEIPVKVSQADRDPFGQYLC